MNKRKTYDKSSQKHALRALDLQQVAR